MLEQKENKWGRGTGGRDGGREGGMDGGAEKDQVSWQRRVHSLYNSTICLCEESFTTCRLTKHPKQMGPSDVPARLIA